MKASLSVSSTMDQGQNSEPVSLTGKLSRSNRGGTVIKAHWARNDPVAGSRGQPLLPNEVFL